MKVIIAGGGTGGHLFPGIAVAREIQRRHPGSEVLFVGAEQGIETKLVPKEGFPLKTLPLGGIKGVGGCDDCVISQRRYPVFKKPRRSFESSSPMPSSEWVDTPRSPSSPQRSLAGTRG